MNQSLKDLESRLEGLAPRGLSDRGRERCHALIDALAGESETSASCSARHPAMATAVAAALALGLGVGGGWYLGGHKSGEKPVADVPGNDGSSLVGFDQLDHQAWLIAQGNPDVYVDENGEIREIFREVEVTKEVVKHRESGFVVTVETTDHHLVDSIKSDF